MTHTGRGRKYTIPRSGGRWPARMPGHPGIYGRDAWKHPDAIAWRRLAREELEPRHPVVLVTPCSNVKPYPRSPSSAKIRGVLRRLGLWDPEGPGLYGAPRGVEWIYLSDLLGVVPYDKAHEYPACCYEFPPDLAMDGMAGLVIPEIRGVLERYLSRGRARTVVLYLPRLYLRVALPVVERSGVDVRVVRYHIFWGHRELEKELRGVIGEMR